jgi:hypothetical protein
METLPKLDNADEIRKYCLSHPCNSLAGEKIEQERRHWNTLCDKRLYEEIRMGRRNNPISTANVYRLGGLVVAALSFPASFAGPLVGLPLAATGFDLYIYGQIEDYQKKRRREPIDASAAKPTGAPADVTPRMTRIKKNDNTVSMIAQDRRL